MPHGHAYLCAVMDWHSSKVLGWAVSHTMDSALTEKALTSAVAQSRGIPEIFNTDQGSQFTSPEWTERVAGWITCSSSATTLALGVHMKPWAIKPRGIRGQAWIIDILIHEQLTDRMDARVNFE